MAGERSQVALVEGGVGVLLRVDDPDDRVDQRQYAVDLVPVRDDGGVVVRQVDQDETLQFLVPVAAREGLRRSLPGMASRSSSPAAPSDQTQAMGADVVGLRSPVSEIGTSASALNSADFPLPVAPAMATTVWRDESRCRVEASSSTRPASASVVPSIRVRDSPTNSRRASSRTRSGPS